MANTASVAEFTMQKALAEDFVKGASTILHELQAGILKGQH